MPAGVAGGAAPAEAERDAEVMQERARRTVAPMLAAAGTVQQHMPNDSPEATLNQMAPYVAGWTAAISETAPELAPDISRAIEDELCSDRVGDGQAMVLLRSVKLMPELASSRGVDCALEARQGKEDVVLWEALDAWRHTGLPKTDAVARIEESATDERTLRRVNAEVAARVRARRFGADGPEAWRGR